MSKPVIVGVAGGTGSGKTTVAQRIKEGIGDRSAILQHDWYYHDLSHMSAEERAGINFDHPSSLDTELLLAHVRALKAGEPVACPLYDFRQHLRLPQTRPVKPCPVIIVEGILIFAHEALRNELDLKLFVDTEPDVRVFRRIRRDIRERGRSFESIRAQYFSTVRPMHLEFVEPSKRFADLIIPEGGNNKIALDVIIERLKQFL